MKTTVQRGYLGSERVLVKSDGEVYALGGKWEKVEGVQTVPGEFERFCDVPYGWIGGLVSWK